MKILLLFGAAIILPLICGAAEAQAPKDAGSKIATEAVVLITFAQMGNLGARDAGCKGTPFPTTNIDLLIDSEIGGIIDALIAVDGKPHPGVKNKAITQIRQLALAEVGTKDAALKLYNQRKLEAAAAYGEAGMCASLSTLVQDGMLQKRKMILHLLDDASAGARR